MPGDYFFLNYGVQDGNVMQGLFRVNKTTLQLEVYNGTQWQLAGTSGGTAIPMTTDQRTAITPASGALIWDTDEEALYVGDGVTAGGVAVGGGNYNAGTGIDSAALASGTIAIESGTTLDINITGSASALDSAAIASVSQVINGGTQNIVNVPALRAALTTGQAVDVTSQPDGVTGDYEGTFSVTDSLGFASFPKYASGLNYLMIADLTATTSGTVTPSGTWLDGTTTAKSLAAGTSTRVAMMFNAANKAKFTFTSTGSVSVSNCREYEVTACSNEAIAYIAALSNPDAFASYYLVKSDMVQPWTYIINMGTSPVVTIASGLSYKLNATGTHTLTVDTCPVGYDGRDAIIRITLGGNGVIQAIPPLQLGGALVPYAINNCVVRFRDGEAVLLVEDTLAGYIVTVNSGTGEGSLPYGLAAINTPYIAFSPSTDGTPIDISGATTAAEDVAVVGNGYTETILSGGITCTSKTTFANLGMSGVVVNSGTLTMGDVYIPNGATVSVNGGKLAIENVTGNSGVINLGGTNVFVASGGRMNASGCTFTGGLFTSGGVIYTAYAANANITFENCLISGNSANYAAGFAAVVSSAILNLSSCTITGNSAGNAGALALLYGGTANVVSSVISGNSKTSVYPTDDILVNLNGVLSCTGSTIGTCAVVSGAIVLNGTNKVDAIVAFGAGAGTVTISSGASINLTSSINPGGSITVLTGGCTVNGNAIAAGTYTSIDSTGTPT